MRNALLIAASGLAMASAVTFAAESPNLGRAATSEEIASWDISIGPDGVGLPPGSETSYVMPGLGWLIVVGMCSLLVFLAYELHRWFKYRLWWKYVIYAGDAAMVAIFYHGLRLGSQLQAGWFHMVWWFYGISLIAMLLYKYYKQAQGYQDTKSSSNKAGHENQTH